MLINTPRFQLSRRGATLLIFGFVFQLLGYSYLSLDGPAAPIVRRQLRLALDIAPLEAYGWGWIVCGLVAIACSLVRRLDWIGFGAAVLMPAVWAFAYGAAWLIDDAPRAWVNCALFALLAADLAQTAGMADPRDFARKPPE